MPEFDALPGPPMPLTAPSSFCQSAGRPRWHLRIAFPLVLMVLVACQRSGPELGAVERLTSDASRLMRYNEPYYVAICPVADGGAVVAWMKDESPFRPIVYRRAERGSAPFSAEQYLSPEDLRRTISIVPRLYPGAARGELHATWQARDPRKGDKFVVFRKSRDGGQTWLDAKTLNSETTAFIPALASDAGGIYVGWPDERKSNWQVFLNRSLDGGEAWLPAEVRVDTVEGGNAKDVSVTTNGHGGIVVIWEQQTDKRAVMAAVSNDRGVTWSGPVQIDDGTGHGSPVGPQVVYGANQLVVTWATGVTGKSIHGEVWADVSTDGGLTWGKDVLIKDIQDGLPSTPQLWGDSDVVEVAFAMSGVKKRNSDVYHLTFRGDGGWSALGDRLAPVNGTEGQFASPRLARDARGSSFLVYTDGEARVLLRSSTDQGNHWTTPIVVRERADEKASLHFPQVAAADGVVYVLWEEWSDVENKSKTLAGAQKSEFPADLFLRRVIQRH